MPTITGRKLALELGVSAPMVTKYKAQGKIREEPGGGYDLEKARAQLDDTLGHKQGGVPRRGDRVAGTPLHAPRSEPEPGSKAELEKQALREKVRRERLRNDQLEQTLVNRADVESAVEARFRADAEALLSWPARVVADLSVELGTDQRTTHAVLDKYIREFMRERSMTVAAE